MPGEDRSGPLGKGPRTGRGLGRCGPGTTREQKDGETTETPAATDDTGFPPRGRGQGRGFGRGMGRGPGRGRGRGNW